MTPLSRYSSAAGLLLAAAFAAALPSLAAAADEYPVDLQRDFEFAEREAFDGYFKGAADHVKAARDWIEVAKNRQTLAKDGFQWVAVKANAEAFDAWIESEWGDEARAAVLFKKSLDSLKQLNLNLWAAVVHIQFGDFDFSHAFPAADVVDAPKDTPKAVQDKLSNRHFRQKRACSHYKQAADVILRIPEGGFFAKRLKGRAEHALARCAIVDGEITAAERHLQESEAWFRKMPHFDLFVAPGVKWPKSLKQVKNELEGRNDLTPAQKHLYLAEYSRTIVEWMRLHADQAELVVRKAMKQGTEWGQQHADAEKFFRKAGDLCDVNLRPGHPFRFRSDVSRGIYYIRRAKEMRDLGAKLPPGPDKDKLVAAERSFFLDAAFAAQDALAEMRKLPAFQKGKKPEKEDTMLRSHPLWLDALLLELMAHDAGYPLAGRERDAIIKDMNDWAECQPGK